MAGESQVGKQLGLMHGQYFLHGLDLDHDCIVDEQVETISRLDPYALVLDRDLNLGPERDLPKAELDNQASFVCRLQQARPERTMDLDRRTDDLRSERITIRSEDVAAKAIIRIALCATVSLW